MNSDAPCSCAYNTRTGATIPIPVKAAQTANETASSVRLRGNTAIPPKIKNALCSNSLHMSIIRCERGPTQAETIRGVGVRCLHPCVWNEGARKGPHPTRHHSRPYNERFALLNVVMVRAGVGRLMGGAPCGRPGGLSTQKCDAYPNQGVPPTIGC